MPQCVCLVHRPVCTNDELSGCTATHCSHTEMTSHLLCVKKKHVFGLSVVT